MSSHTTDQARVIPLRPATAAPPPAPKEPLWRHVLGDALRRERLAQERTLKEVAEAARISMPYLSELERGRKEASSEVLAAAARALGLGLADLLALAQGELARFGGRRRAHVEQAAPASGPARRETGSGRSAAGAEGEPVTPTGSLSAHRAAARPTGHQGLLLAA
ncbi:helix-turn-helix domain-containing protein [Streptomyces palmae]|uniref:XRE family transcriptional regulator n=1 Tax=Streptomyces palmae TaxID=1701085 RepID=A0A4Z0HDR2_9ACTN|nr:helix-turn-helix transcriptional regulator [Streptomyces palmae]TGB13403.1 XRE family transcriptional regulator [Streptomyces palmae]